MVSVNIERAKLLTGWMTEPELIWLAEHAQKSQAIIEIGSWHGRSTRALCDNTDGTVIAVDTWEGPIDLNQRVNHFPELLEDGGKERVREQFVRNLGDHIVSGKLHVMNCASLWAAGTIFAALLNDSAIAKPDMIFIDGDHEIAAVYADIQCWLPLLKRGGILCGHDYGDYLDVKNTVDFLFPKREVCETIWSIRKD